MPPRKGHKKSKTGCFQCRRRKVKCEEQKPRCASCVVRRVSCTYPVDLPPYPEDFDSSPPFSSSLNSRGPSEEEFADTPQLPGLPSFRDVDLNILHLKLMHHFSTSTCFTLSNNAEIKDIWRTIVPTIALEQPYVLQAMLSLSALHIARYRPEKRDFYEAYAAQEIESALRKGSAFITNITEENCSAVLSFSLLATLNSLASPQKKSEILLVGENGITEWLYTFRGMGQIANRSWEGLLRSQLAALIFVASGDLEDGIGIPPEKDALNDLKDLLLEELETRPSAQANIEAVDHLLVCFSTLHNRSRSACEMPSILVWPCKVSKEFVGLLSEKDPWSLVVLAYFCVLMNRAEGFWWMEGWPVSVLSHIWGLLDVRYRMKIRWPMESIGWVPPSLE